jgi:hypothetical protein
MPFSDGDILFITVSFILFVCETGVFAVREKHGSRILKTKL